MAEDREGMFKRIEKLNSISRGFQGAVVLTTAAEYEIFELLEAGPLSPAEVAKQRGLDERSTGLLLHALAGMELLDKKPDGSFGNSPVATEFLVRGRQFYQGDILRHSGHLIRRWSYLPEVLRTGEPAPVETPLSNQGQRRDFILGMSNIARLGAESIADVLGLTGTRHMLDLGGGPATFAITFCRKNPKLRATVFDLPEVIDEVTLEEVRKAGLAERIDFVRGNYLTDDYGTGYDLIFISSIIHSLGVEGNRELIRRSHRALAPGGRLVVKDFLLDDNMVTPAFASMFAINMLVGTEAGRCFSIGEVRAWMTELGFGLGLKVLDHSPQNRMVIGVKEG